MTRIIFHYLYHYGLDQNNFFFNAWVSKDSINNFSKLLKKESIFIFSLN